MVEHRNRKYTPSQPSPSFGQNVQQTLDQKYRAYPAHVETRLSDREIISLLEMTQRQLVQGQASLHEQEEYLASCWQLCGLGCHPADNLCMQQQCDSLCLPPVQQRLLPQVSAAQHQQHHRQLRTSEYNQNTLSGSSRQQMSAKELIADAKSGPVSKSQQEKAREIKEMELQRQKAASSVTLPEDFMEEEKVLQSRRPYSASANNKNYATHQQASNSIDFGDISQNDILGETFADSQNILLQHQNDHLPLEAVSSQMQQNSLPEPPQSNQMKLPPYTVPLIGGLSIIIVFCFMIGLLILEPGTKEKQAKKRKQEEQRRKNLRKIASESWSTQPERLENQVSGNLAEELDNQVYKKL